MLEVSKEITFAAAHELPGYNGPCCRLHGHEWRCRVTVQRPDGQLKEGMVVDFRDLKVVLKQEVDAHLDHRFINDFVSYPTAENMVEYLRDRIIHHLAMQIPDCRLVKLELWETPDSRCTWTIDA